MGIMSKILGGGGNRSTEDYVTLDLEADFDSPGAANSMRVQFAEIAGQQDVIAIKDAVYDGDLVIADITRHSTTDAASDRIIDELRQVAQEVDGDIVQKGDDQIVITPTGVGISREKLN
ncbi:cell division protein SepF [Halolamina litorea]|uniref:Cell division protein SepF n=1 Tax=Halolamina litorea TaxID=1515593 RepID=A0ABD6BP35_9EURY|nr:cell division protein SepF [Halolamina litorea]